MGCMATPAIPEKTRFTAQQYSPKRIHILKKKRFDLPILPSYDFIVNLR